MNFPKEQGSFLQTLLTGKISGQMKTIIEECRGSEMKSFTHRARGADFQVGGLTRTRKREPTRGVRGHAPPGKFEILFF